MLEPTQKRSAALARMGAAVFAYDMVGYGESTPVPHLHSESMRLQTYNSLRAVDFLLSLGMVDEKRLGITGESGGGTQSYLLAAIDDRIAVSVPVVMVAAGFYGACVCESGMPIHKSAEFETDNVEIAASFAPKPQMIISDGGDWTKNTPRLEFPYMQRVYALMGARTTLRMRTLRTKSTTTANRSGPQCIRSWQSIWGSTFRRFATWAARWMNRL